RRGGFLMSDILFCKRSLAFFPAIIAVILSFESGCSNSDNSGGKQRHFAAASGAASAPSTAPLSSAARQAKREPRMIVNRSVLGAAAAAVPPQAGAGMRGRGGKNSGPHPREPESQQIAADRGPTDEGKDAETYAAIAENPFHTSATEPLST